MWNGRGDFFSAPGASRHFCVRVSVKVLVAGSWDESFTVTVGVPGWVYLCVCIHRIDAHIKAQPWRNQILWYCGNILNDITEPNVSYKKHIREEARLERMQALNINRSTHPSPIMIYYHKYGLPALKLGEVEVIRVGHRCAEIVARHCLPVVALM